MYLMFLIRGDSAGGARRPGAALAQRRRGT